MGRGGPCGATMSQVRRRHTSVEHIGPEGDGPLMPLYVVTFLHQRHRTRFMQRIDAPTPDAAQAAVRAILSERAERIEEWHLGEIALDTEP